MNVLQNVYENVYENVLRNVYENVLRNVCEKNVLKIVQGAARCALVRSAAHAYVPRVP